ncbi:MAG: c-type cytochrome [Candidatus Acidiferrales bacterium]
MKRSTTFLRAPASSFMKWPRRFLFWSALGLAVCASAGCRLDMHVQPKYTPDKPTAFFGDGRSERPEVPGTIAHGEFHGGELLYTGLIDGKPADAFPFPITAKDLDRGRSRYNIYCAPCHDYNGTGRGMIVLRGFQQPPSYHIDRLRQAPVGHFFEVITNGFGKMYSYASRISPEDRWRIAAYIRALQLSEHATLADVPADKRSQLEAPEMQPAQGSPEKPAQQNSAREKGTQKR